MENNSTKPFSYETFPASGLVAYFSMEIAINPAMPTYSGGLGMLAGDTLRSAADLGVPLVAFTLAHRKGYFQQHLNGSGEQSEEVQPWNPADFCTEEPARITVSVEDRVVTVRAWRYDLAGRYGHVVPIYLLDTDLDGNSGWDRGLTDHLYGGDTNYSLQQEIVLGMGGARMANALGLTVNVYHMNEGHAALLTLALLEGATGRRTAGRGDRIGHRTGAAQMRVHDAYAGACGARSFFDRAVDSHSRRRPHRAAGKAGLFPRRPAEHDSDCAALFALCQRRGDAARQSFARDVSGISRSTRSPTECTRRPG